MALLTNTDAGLYCAAGDFYVDPWHAVEHAVVTHAHADHARPGCGNYLAAKEGDAVLRSRLSAEVKFQFVNFGESIQRNGVRISLHPAGHIRGSAQVRIEHQGEVCVVSGDYKLDADPTTSSFEPEKCHTFVTESTFGLPIYRWPAPGDVVAEIHDWWTENQTAGRASILFAYAVGKAQRLLACLDTAIGPLFAHGAILKACQAYRHSGCPLPKVGNVLEQDRGYDWSNAMVLAPPSVRGSTWLRRFGNVSLATASGWMRVRGVRRRRALDRGFIFSDHADWRGLNQAIAATQAENVWITHGYTAQLRDYLLERKISSEVVATQFSSNELDDLSSTDAGKSP